MGKIGGNSRDELYSEIVLPMIVWIQKGIKQVSNILHTGSSSVCIKNQISNVMCYDRVSYTDLFKG